MSQRDQDQSEASEMSFSEDVVLDMQKYHRILTCSLTAKVMADPVTLETGITCERSAIAQRLSSKTTCPVSHEQLMSLELYPNILARELLSDMGLKLAPLPLQPANGSVDQVSLQSYIPHFKSDILRRLLDSWKHG